ncbi:MAG TPA: glyoxalase [Actinobacteria bacterium]|jgi:catechol 2,3-dioxygenase-like lactoylglutathione lyase family enzyme|nr:glyoxalase [Actinomycetota bacterium]
MLNAFDLGTTLPVADMERAKAFYADKLGLKPERERPDGVEYRSGNTTFLLYPTQFAGTAQNTAAGWRVDDALAVVKELASNGVQFEQYDMPGLKTDENGIAEFGAGRGAWFKDSEGNILAIVQMDE